VGEEILVSIIMPVYNGDKYLHESIVSILNQTYTNFEFIIINDGSIDNSELIILSFKDERIKYIKNETNLKLIATLNLGFDIAVGKYIARMDADDISHPKRIEKQVKFLDLNIDYGLVGTGVNLLNGVTKSQLLYHVDYKSIKFALSFYCPFIHPSVMLRKSVIDELDVIYDARYMHAEDYELWTRLAFKTKMANLPEYLLDYRIHDAQISSRHTFTQEEMAIAIREKYLKYYFPQNLDFITYVFQLSKQPLLINTISHQIYSLYILNKESRFFEGGNLNHYLILLWKNSFLESKNLTLKTYFYFISKSITYKSTWSLRQFLAIFIKVFK